MTDQVEMLGEEPTQEATALATYSPVEAGLQELEKRMGNVAYDLTTVKGDKAARADRAECVRLRTSADGIYEAWNKPMLALQRDMRATRDEIKGRILAIEGPVDAQIKADEARRKAVQAERERVEAEKRAAIQAAINRITGFAMDAVGESSAVIDGLHLQLMEMDISIETFGDRTGEATQIRNRVSMQLEGLFGNAKAHEDQQAELARQRAELAAQQEQARKEAEAAERQRAAREAEERVAREQQEARDRAARAKQEAADKEARDKAEAEAQTIRIEQARIAQIEADRIAAEQKARADELAAREAQIAAREFAARQAEEERQRRADAERAAVQHAADEAAAAERKRLDDIAAAERAEQDRIAREQREVEEQEARAALTKAAQEAEAHRNRISRLHNASEAMLGALQVVAATPRIPKEVLAIVNDAIALALIDGEEA